MIARRVSVAALASVLTTAFLATTTASAQPPPATTSSDRAEQLYTDAKRLVSEVFAGSSALAFQGPHNQIQVVRAGSDGGVEDGGVTMIRPRGTAELASAHAVVVEPDGHVIVGGYADFAGAPRHVAIARFDAKGTLDTKFGVDGLVLVNLGKPAEVKRLALQGSSVIAAIVTTSAADGRDVVLMRIKP